MRPQEAPSMTTPPLFDAPQPLPPRRSRILQELDAAARPHWARYRPVRRVPCDECIAVLHEDQGVGPYAQSARWRRTQEGCRPLLLCHIHAELWKAEGR